MLVTFHSKSYYPITMFGEVALQLLEGMGTSGKIPGALYAEDVPQALWQLQQWLASQQPEPADPMLMDVEPAAQAVGIQQRAQPLLEMLQGAAKQEHSVSWD